MVHVASTSCIWLAVLIQSATAFYIPGVAPLDFRKGEEVEVKVRSSLFDADRAKQPLSLSQAVKMTSTKTQLPYDYYDVAVHCKPSNGTKYKSENLGNTVDKGSCASREQRHICL